MSSQAPREERDFTMVLQDDLRPNGDGVHCFYCTAELGQKHDEKCIIRKGAGQYLVAIHDNVTGETRMYREDTEWSDVQEFLWEDGNFSCDCNRGMMFKRAAGEDGRIDWDNLDDCAGSRYDVLYIELPSGEKIQWVALQ